MAGMGGPVHLLLLRAALLDSTKQEIAVFSIPSLIKNLLNVLWHTGSEE
jgi:hypothetical protein